MLDDRDLAVGLFAGELEHHADGSEVALRPLPRTYDGELWGFDTIHGGTPSSTSKYTAV
jgi:hypothetical protein